MRIGPSADPWGTPCLSTAWLELNPWIETGKI